MGNELMENKTNETETIKKPAFVLNRKDMIFAMLFAFASFLFSALSIWGGFKIGYTVTSIFTFVAFTAYLYNKDTKIKVYSLLCGIMAVVTSLLFSMTGNMGVRFFSFIVVIGLSVVWFNSLVSSREEDGDLGIIRMIFRNIFMGSCYNLDNTCKGLFLGEGKHRKMVRQVLIGALMAIPVLVVVIPLMMSSDAAFEGLADKIFNQDSKIIRKLIVGIVIAPFVISFGFALKKNQVPERKEINYKGIDSTIVVSFLSMLSISYVAYLVSQLAYFFSAFSGFLPEDYSFTVAAYARRGFFEMSIIAAINMFIIFLTLILSKKKDGKLNIAARVLCTFIGGFTLVIISTALSKMVLYIKSFGMTQLRITTSAFMIFLAIVFISIIARLYVVKVPVIKVALLTAAVILSVLGIGNVNHVVADYNYNAYISGKLEDIDMYTIYNQGAEGVPYLVKLTEAEDETVVAEAKSKLYLILSNEKYYSVYYDSDLDAYLIDQKVYDDFEEMNIPLSRAYEALEELLKEPFQNKGYNDTYMMR